MKKWICKVCGYTHQGAEAPDRCPKCGASKDQFFLDKDNKNGRNAMIALSVIALTTIIFTSFYACRSSGTVDNSAVKDLDLNRYLGKWYEIARFNHRFEKGMEQCTATYRLQEDGTIKVTNQGMKNGNWKTSVGKAKVTDVPGVLRVSFFGPFYSDYRIMMLAEDYSYALVGGNGDKYLWILSRTPQLDEDVRKQILQEAQRRGYQTDNLIWVEQTAH